MSIGIHIFITLTFASLVVIAIRTKTKIKIIGYSIVTAGTILYGIGDFIPNKNITWLGILIFLLGNLLVFFKHDLKSLKWKN